jgi:hypothetical protein
MATLRERRWTDSDSGQVRRCGRVPDWRLAGEEQAAREVTGTVLAVPEMGRWIWLLRLKSETNDCGEEVWWLRGEALAMCCEGVCGSREENGCAERGEGAAGGFAGPAVASVMSWRVNQ